MLDQLPSSLIPAKEDAQSAFLHTLATQVRNSTPLLHLPPVLAPTLLLQPLSLASATAAQGISSAAGCALQIGNQQQQQLLLHHLSHLLLQQLNQLLLLLLQGL